MKVLIIEDNEANRKLAKKMIEKMEHLHLEADNAEAGIELARAEQPDLILMDMDLPGMNGITATGILKQDPATSSIPIIAFTAFAMKGDREAMLSAGCDDYISKPIGYFDFVAKLNEWLTNNK